MKKTQAAHIGKAVDDTLEVVNDFICQIPFWGYQVAAYREYEHFSNLILELDSYLEKLFEGEIDDGNGDVLDCLIADRARANFKYLAKQKVEHRGMMKMFEVQRQGAKRAFEEHLDSIEKLFADKDAERNDILKRYNADKFEGGTANEYGDKYLENE